MKKIGSHLKTGEIKAHKSGSSNPDRCRTCNGPVTNHASVMEVVEDSYGNRRVRHAPCPAR